MIEFAEIARRYLQPENSALEQRRCPDQFVGVISEISRCGEFCCRVSVSERPAHQPCVLLILESPHKAEFVNDLGPAKGATGRKIRQYLLQVPGIEGKENFGLILINAVQFQCSLGQRTSQFRDAVFRDIWSSGGRVDFESRFRAIYRDGDCVVNCCTKGDEQLDVEYLRDLVQRSLIAQLPADFPILRRNHPAYWQVLANRSREWPFEG